MDLLNFEADDLYFNHEDPVDVRELIQQASHEYASGDAELPLLQAFLRAPESLNVLVSLNRFYYYQHRLQEALLISERALNIITLKLQFPEQWQDLTLQDITSAPKEKLSWIRLYLFTLKSIGFLNMRLYQLPLSQAIFEKLVALDREDRIGASGLLELVRQKIQEPVPTA
jgi:hypothetical protein